MNNNFYKYNGRKHRVKKHKRIKRIMIFILMCFVISMVIFLVNSISNFLSLSNSESKASESSIKIETSKNGQVTGKNNTQATDNTTIGQLKSLAKSNKKINTIINNIDDYPENLLQLLIRNQETVDFVLNYPTKKDSTDNIEEIKLTSKETNSEIPLFIQWDNRWGYAKYGEEIMGLSGCGPTCLSMVIVGLTGDTSANPREVAKFSESNGYRVPGNGTDWSLFSKGAKKYDLKVKELPLWEDGIIKEIENGHPIICCVGPGDFTTTGHFILIYGYEDGEFLIHDPNSIIRSSKKWSYEKIKGQIRNLWSYSY